MKDQLYEENLSLKTQSNLLIAENLRLRTKITQIEKGLKKEDPEVFIRTLSKPSLVPNLKSSIKSLKFKIKTKKQEIENLKKSMKSTKMMETDVELQIYSDEMTRLSHHLQSVMKENNISFQMLEFEEQISTVVNEISLLRSQNLEYGQILANSREELMSLQENIRNLESPKKKKKKISKKKEIQDLVNLKQEITAKISVEREEFEEKSRKTLTEIESLTRSNREILESLRIVETRLKEQNIIADQLKSQISNDEKEIKRSQTNNFNVSSARMKKLKDPPKLFQKIHMIIYKRKMFDDIFFSIMDRNSNGIIDVEEIYNCLNTYGIKIKRKYIFEAFKLMEISGNSIQLSVIQEHYDKYDYQFIEDDSSSEEILEIKKKTVERLNYHESKASLPEGLILPTTSAPIKRVFVEEKKIPPVNLHQIIQTLEEIQKKMQKMKLSKNKLLLTVFGSDIDPYELLTVEKLEEVFNDCSLNLSSKSEIKLLSRFLLENDSKVEITESQISELKSELLQVCKKFAGLFDDWPVFNELDWKQAVETIQGKILFKKAEVLKQCQDLDIENSGSLPLSSFKHLCESFEIDEKHWQVWAVEIFPSLKIDYSLFLSSIKVPLSGREALYALSNSLSSNSISPESLFEISPEGVISGENFLESLSKLNLKLSDSEQFELLDHVSSRHSGKFTKVVHIHELNRKLSEIGFKPQILSSDDESLSLFPA
jgi:hypothetical protein